MFKGVLYKLGIGRREAVFGGERFLRPNHGVINRCDVPKRNQQLLPRSGRLLGFEGARLLAIDAVTTLSIAGPWRLHPRPSVRPLERVFVSWRRGRARTITKIGRIQIVLASNPDQREQCVAAGVGQRGAHALGIGSFGDGTNRPIRCDPFAGGVRKRGGQIDHPGGLVDGGGLHGGNLMLPERLAHDVEATGEGRITEARSGPSPGAAGRIEAVSDFSGLTSSAWALASAEAIGPRSLDRGMVALRHQDVEAHRA